jgi:hypothetical protein
MTVSSRWSKREPAYSTGLTRARRLHVRIRPRHRYFSGLLLATCITITDAVLGMRLPSYRSNDYMQTAERCRRVFETVEASREREVVAAREDLKRCR